jgi:hypothetical protein
MVVDWIDAQADDFDVALVKLGFDPRHVAELSRAYRREILGMRERSRNSVSISGHSERVSPPHCTTKFLRTCSIRFRSAIFARTSG